VSGFQIEDGTPWIGATSYPWAKEVFDDRHSLNTKRPDPGWPHCHRGFHLAFENAWAVSIQWGTGNYCANRDALWQDASGTTRPFLEDCPDAEVATWDDTGDFDVIEAPGWGDTVLGWQRPTEVQAIIEWVQTWTTSQAPEESMIDWMVNRPDKTARRSG